MKTERPERPTEPVRLRAVRPSDAATDRPTASRHAPGSGPEAAPRPGYTHETLASLLDAIEVARVDLEEGLPEAVPTLLRLVQSLYPVVRAEGHEALAQAVEAVEAAFTDELHGDAAAVFVERVEALVAALRDAVAAGEAPPVRLLVIAPDPDEAAMLTVILSTPHREVLVVHTAAEAEVLLARRTVALIVMDLVLPDMDGRNLLVRLRGRSNTAATPIYILSALAQPQVKTECYALGADAFFEKPFDPAAFAAAVASRLQRRTQRDTVDPLTGLPDRVALEEAFERAAAFYDFTRTPMSVGLIDFDDFSALNDLYGPATGDDVLQQATALITHALRDFDLIGRWEADRFCVLFPDTLPEEAAELLDRALQTVRSETFTSPNGHPFHVSFSAAVTLIKRNDATLDEAVEAARRLVAEAKREGRGRVVTEDRPAPHAPPRVLLVEDDEDIAAIIRFRLERDGFAVTHFEDGSRAVAFAEQHRAALVILDVKMPGMDGFEVLTHLRKMPAYARTPVIMLTSMGREQDVLRGFELGADDYILKPFSPVELSARARRLVARRRHPHRD